MEEADAAEVEAKEVAAEINIEAKETAEETAV